MERRPTEPGWGSARSGRRRGPGGADGRPVAPLPPVVVTRHPAVGVDGARGAVRRRPGARRRGPHHARVRDAARADPPGARQQPGRCPRPLPGPARPSRACEAGWASRPTRRSPPTGSRPRHPVLVRVWAMISAWRAGCVSPTNGRSHGPSTGSRRVQWSSARRSSSPRRCAGSRARRHHRRSSPRRTTSGTTSTADRSPTGTGGGFRRWAVGGSCRSGSRRCSPGCWASDNACSSSRNRCRRRSSSPVSWAPPPRPWRLPSPTDGRPVRRSACGTRWRRSRGWCWPCTRWRSARRPR